jgi:hypothetical protein
VLGNEALAARLRRQGQQEAVARFGWAGIAEQTRQVYEEVLALAEAGHRPARPVAPEVRPRYLTGSEAVSRS